MVSASQLSCSLKQEPTCLPGTRWGPAGARTPHSQVRDDCGSSSLQESPLSEQRLLRGERRPSRASPIHKGHLKRKTEVDPCLARTMPTNSAETLLMGEAPWLLLGTYIRLCSHHLTLLYKYSNRELAWKIPVKNLKILMSNSSKSVHSDTTGEAWWEQPPLGGNLAKQ
jgi:hypothetical protein